MKRLLINCLINVQFVLWTSALAQANPVFDYPQDSEFVLISYNQNIPLIANQDPQPLLRIFGDGKVRVHFPIYMKKAGDYEMQLTQEQLLQLLKLIEEKNLLQFDGNSVVLLKQEILKHNTSQANSTSVSVRSDDVHSDIQINLESYSSSEKGISASKVQKRVSWPNLKWEAQRYPNIAALVNAASVEEKLQQIVNHPDLRKIK